MATVAEPLAPAIPGDSPFEVPADLFFRMIELELIPADRRVYLWNGGLREKMAKTVAHALTSVIIHEALRRRLPPGWLLWPENPIRLDARHAPLPDIPVVRGPLETYKRDDRHPEAGDVGMLVEVAVSSLAADLGEVAEKYARALIPVYWVADVKNRRILTHQGPRVVDGRGEYARVEPFGPGQAVPLVLDGVEIGRIPVEELLP